MQHIKKPTVRTFIIFLTSILLINCNGQVSTVKDPTIDLKEGKLVYSISGDKTTSNWELEILFNQDNTVIKEKYSFGAGRKYIFDKKSKEILGLIDEASFFGIKKDSYFIYYTPEKLEENALSSNYGKTIITPTQEFKEILGYKCQKSIIKHGEQVTGEVWLTDKIKPGIIYPWTPLTFDKIALEYETKTLGRIDRKYIIKSISDQKIDKKEFEHIVPEQYYLVVPCTVFSIDSIWMERYKENTFLSFSYPYFREGRQSTMQFLRDELYKIIPKDDRTNISINFFVNKDGRLSDIDVRINYNKKDKRIETMSNLLKSMKPWTPAKVKGNAVKSQVTIFA